MAKASTALSSSVELRFFKQSLSPRLSTQLSSCVTYALGGAFLGAALVLLSGPARWEWVHRALPHPDAAGKERISLVLGCAPKAGFDRPAQKSTVELAREPGK